MKYPNAYIVSVTICCMLASVSSHAAITETGDVTTSGSAKIVGNTGVGTYSVDGGTAAVESTMRLGDTPTGDGTGLVTGAGSSLEIDNGVLNIGSGGTGLFTISDGGTVLISRDPTATGSQGAFAIAQPAGSVGELIVTGNGSSLTGSAAIAWMGASGQATLTIEDNATVTAFDQTLNNPFFRIAQNADGEATINVRTGGLLDITGAGNDVVHLPESGTATLNIESGGRMLAGRMRVAQLGNASADINITGAGSELEADFLFAAQDPNTVVTIDVDNGGILDIDQWLYVGQEGTGTLNVSGGGTVDVAVDLFVGGEIGAVAGDGTMTVTDGASVIVSDDLYIGTDISTGVFSISGDGTTLVVDDRLYVGWGFAGFPATGTLEVGRGAEIRAILGEGLNFADAVTDQATALFHIGDDGTGSIESGLIETSTLAFGAGTSTLNIQIDSGIDLNLGDVFTLIDYNAWDGGLFANAFDDQVVSFGGAEFLINYNDDLGGGDLALTATYVPEPTTAALLIPGLALLAARKRKA